MKVVRLTFDEAQQLASGLLMALGEGTLLIAYDDVDQALKLKLGGRWSPPLGTLEVDD